MNIKYTGPIYGSSGYAKIRSLLLKLHERGHTVRIEPYKGLVTAVSDRDKYRVLEQVNVSKPYIHITSGIAPQIRIDDSAAWNIAYSMFETDALPERWADFYNEFDEIWTPSYFCKRAFDVKSLNCMVSVIPYGIDTKMFFPIERKAKEFVFLSVGKWIDRKGWDILIKAYVEEFMGNMDVRLCIKTDGAEKEPCDMIQEILGSECNPQMPRILINTDILEDNLIAGLYREADCYVTASRGEAFGLPILEAMASGLPVITPEWGGQMDFVNDNVGWMIPVNILKRLSERQCSINAMYRGLWFAEPDVKDVRIAMRKAYDNRDEGRQKGMSGRELVETDLTWDSVTDMAEERLKDIWQQIN